jgi:YihY family inner membrane protein
MLHSMNELRERREVLLGKEVHRRASLDGLGTLAAALTYSAFLSLLPLVLLGLSVAGFLLAGDPGRQASWRAHLTGSIPGLAPLIGRNLTAVVDGRIGTGIVGLIGVVWTASGLASSASHALGLVFRTARPGPVRRRLDALASMAGLGALGLVSIAITSFATGWNASDAIGVSLRVLGVAAGFAVDLGFFLAVYRALTPGRGPSFRGHLPGAALMAFGWTLLKLAGSWYTIRVATHATALYGTVGGVFGLLAILSIAARIFLYGAELSAVLAEEH